MIRLSVISANVPASIGCQFRLPQKIGNEIPCCSSSGRRAAIRRADLGVDRADAAEVVVVLGDLEQSRLGNIPASGDVLEKRQDVLATLRAPKTNNEDRVVGGRVPSRAGAGKPIVGRGAVHGHCTAPERGALPGPLKQVFQIGLSTWPRVGAVAMVEQGEPGVVGDPIAVEPVDLPQPAGKRHAGKDELCQRDQVAGSVATASQAQSSGQISHSRTGRIAVVPQSVRKQNRVQGAMMDAAATSQGVRQGVDDTQAFVKADPSQQGTHHHGGPSLGVGAVANGCLQTSGNVSQPLHGEPVADWVKGGGEIAFHAMSEGVHAGPRGQDRRKLASQVGVADRGAGQKVRAQDGCFATRLRELNQGAAAGLAPVPAVVGIATKGGREAPILS